MTKPTIQYGQVTRINGCTQEDREPDKDAYHAMLRDCYGDVEVCGMQMDAARILREMDPTAYRCGYNDWSDSERTTVYTCDTCGTEHDDEDDARDCCECWQCEECGATHGDEDEAKECCERWI